LSPQELALSTLLFGLPLLIFIGVIVGSRLAPRTKRRVETYVLMPLFVVISGGWLGMAALHRWWVQLAILIGVFGFAAHQLVKRIRELRRPPQTS
jgi:predicted MFS family arabinose efflux permease